MLRVRSPSAEVQGHSPSERKTVGGKRNVAIIGVAPVGNYAVRLDFDDMHRTGIYTWRYLRELGEAGPGATFPLISRSSRRRVWIAIGRAKNRNGRREGRPPNISGWKA